ncbi:hypothetical protein [Roseibacillus persicicus]|uniref:hypothetical protein n=1 Tax=Roseibacillus persicicus TaxID=454148 RepID=UPI002810329F|nr:hypothetical protein [Roseibacillus persicicus]MDQ8189080.1 hypothetical protein [Roseibacillus persicicus]
MFRAWTARIVLAALTLEIGLICSLYMGDLPLLRRTEEGVFQTFLSWVRDFDSRQVILETNPEADGWSLRSLEREETGIQNWSFVEVPLEPELFDGHQPKPSEYAILLAKMYQSGARELAFSQPLNWEEAPELELLALDSALRPFSEVLLPLDLSEVPQPEASPAWLTESLVGRTGLIGDASSLPLMNQVMVPPSVSGRSGVEFAFPDFGGRDLQFRAPGRLPVLARWGEDFLLSWPLSLAMRMEGVTPEELIIAPGRSLRLGPDGPVIPLDDFGRAKIDEVEPPLEELPTLSAKSFFPLGEVDLPELSNGAVLIGQTDLRMAEKSQRLVAEARHLLQFPRPGKAESFRRLSLGWEVFLYCEIVLVAIFALYLRPFPQLIALAVLCGGLFFFALGLLNWRGLWTPVLPLVAAMTMSWCLVGYLQQIAHPVRKKKPKVV